MKRFIAFIVAFTLLFAAAESRYIVSSLTEGSSGTQQETEPAPSREAEPELTPEPAHAPTPEPTPEPEPSCEPEPEASPEPEPEAVMPEEDGEEVPEGDEEDLYTENPDEEDIDREYENCLYYVMINVEANVVNVYTKDENGEFTVPYKAMVCCSGPDTPTSGAYSPGVQHRWWWLFGGVCGQFTTQIVGNYLFHSVPYTEYGNPASLEYWEFDKMGTCCSMGCIRLQVKDAQWIYENAWCTYRYEFYESSDPGPLGKPSCPTISDDEIRRNWDPSDPDENNPWTNEEAYNALRLQWELEHAEPEPTPSPEPESPEPSDSPAPESSPDYASSGDSNE